ncbi:hypothetical protein [Streptomyces phaeofaciens]|uniref:hypothetical protein n=1 Tax=Streptomyces phaeofaciens TaxID=68254 RepID=UPI0036A383CB
MRTGWVRLWRWTAWGGIGLSLYAGWLTVDDVRDRASSERDIVAGCDRLVSGAEVMDLRGGSVRARTSDYDEYRLDIRDLPGSCTVYQVPRSGGTKGLFTLVVRTSGAPDPLNWIGDDSGLEPFYAMDGESADPTAIADRRPEPRPLGDGSLGWYTNEYATVRAECGPGSRATAPKLLHVTARADYDDVSAADRRRLVRLAHTATERLTDRLGCRTRLKALPDGEQASVPSALGSARTAGGSCRWFAGHLAAQGQGRLPDRALASPSPDTGARETCLLAVSPAQVRRSSDGLDEEESDYARSALSHSPWWLRTASYFGAEARTVGYDDIGEDVIIEAGTAGHGGGAWWASSVCDGEPALHTLSTSYLYDNVLDARTLSDLFHAYVDDITERRGCTDVTYPDARDFRSS